MVNNMNPALLLDFYKTGHQDQYPKGTTKVVSNFTCRASRLNTKYSVFFGLQYYITRYLCDEWGQDFFCNANAPEEYERILKNSLGPTAPSIDNIRALHKLGYLPIEIRALPEGTRVPIRMPCYTIHNTLPEFYWLPNFLETQMSATIWPMINSATIADLFKQKFVEMAKKTGASLEFVPWQGHDFSMRGMFGLEAAIMSGASHLLSFNGTDTVPAIDFLENYYAANSDNEVIGGSVPATEHAVMCVGIALSNEYETFKRLITETYPEGIVSIVSDTFDFWNVVDDILPRLREVINTRKGKVVIRPDSGDPVKIICGDPEGKTESERLGLVQRLFQIFGGVKNAAGYLELNPHIGVIYGDSINLDRQKAILEGLAALGFASSNVVLGIGSYTYQYNTRDTLGCAIKATYCEVDGKAYNIFKKPKTDDGVKNSMKGLPFISNLKLREEATWEEFISDANDLKVVYKDGAMFGYQSLSGIRSRLALSLL